MQELIADLDLAIKVAYQAGELAKYYQENGFEELDPKDEELGDPNLTNADIAIDAFIYHRLMEQTPSYGWLSEEKQTQNLTEGLQRVWVVDPIDGTKNFIKQNGMFAISIALIENGCPMIGVIYNPMRDQMFYCLRGNGMFLNNQQMTTNLQEMQDCFVISPIGRKNKEHGQKLIKATSQFEEVGSVAYRLALIAAGQADFTFVDHNISLWDIAAGSVMLEEQGIEIKDLFGNCIDYLPNNPHIKKGIIACKDHLFEDVQNCLQHLI